MKLVDANVLIYAVDSNSTRHAEAYEWLVGAMNDPSEALALPWTSLLAFVRITTNPRIMSSPLSAAEAMALVEQWLAVPHVVTPEPTVRHAHVLAGLLTGSGTAANLTTDAHLAALCIEHGATMVSFDGDMTRFGIPCSRPGS